MKPIELYTKYTEYDLQRKIDKNKFLSSIPELKSTIENIEEAYRQLEIINRNINSLPTGFSKSKELINETKKLQKYIKRSILVLRKDIKFYKKDRK